MSLERVKLGDPLGTLLFCITIHRLIASLKLEFIVFYVDDGTMGGNLTVISSILREIEEIGKDLGTFECAKV